MNPFTESTVARPVPKNHCDRHWTHLNIDADSPQPSKPAAPTPDCGTGRSPYGCRAHSPSEKTPDVTSPMRGKSLWGAVGLGLSLLLSAGAATISSPAFMTGAVVVAGLTVPGYAHAIDLNQASEQELQAVSGIGPKTAAMIVNERTRGGSFTSLSDLSDRVRGIGPKKAAALQAAGLKVASAGTATASAASAAPRSAGSSARR